MDLVVDATSAVPPYEQVRAHVAGLVAHGGLPTGTRLPTVRQLATDLGIAAGTVARAYRELEADGVIETGGRRGSFVRSTAVPDARLADAARDFVTATRTHGLTCPEALRLVEEAWSQ